MIISLKEITNTTDVVFFCDSNSLVGYQYRVEYPQFFCY